MRKLVAILIITLSLPSIGIAQSTTTATATVKDPSGTAYAFGTYAITFTNPTTQQAFYGGVPLQPSQMLYTGQLDINGALSVSLPSNAVITPSGTQWTFKICANPSQVAMIYPPPTLPCFSSAQTISGASPQVISFGGAVTAIPTAGGGVSPSSLTTFFNKFMGLAPEDFGASGDVKWCFDGRITNGQTAFTSTIPNQTITTTSLTSNIALYTVTSTAAMFIGQNVSVTGSTNGGGVFNITNKPIVAIPNGTQFSVTLVNANVGSAGDTGTVVENCAQFTSSDVGKIIDIVGAGAAGVTYHGTITGFSSVTGVTVSPAASTTVTAAKFLYGHDDTGPLVTNSSNWCSSIANGFPAATGLKTHQGYLTKWYYITQTCRIVNPIGANGFTPQGYGSPEPFSTANAAEALTIYGTGGLNSGFAMAPQGTFNFGCPTVSASGNTGVLYYKWWNGIQLQNFGIIADSGSTYDTTACTGTANVALMFTDLNGHETSNNIELEDAHNTTNTFAAHLIAGSCFESHFHDFQIYNNDLNGYYGQQVVASGASVWDQCTLDSMVWEGWKGATNVALFFNEGGGTGGNKIINSRLIDSGVNGTGGELALASTFATVAGSEFVIENSHITSSIAGNYDIATNASATGRVRLTNVMLSNSASTAATNLITNSGALTFSQNGGTWNCSATCVNGIANSTGGFIFASDVLNVSGRAGKSGTGLTSIFTMEQSAVAGTGGWNGPGTWASTNVLSNQGAACTNGELALSAGWQSTGSATVTAVAGTGQTCSWTITTGTTTAANPTVTDTLTNPLPTATTVCELNIHGGTHTAAANDAFSQTTLSATAPVFTSNFTPTAGGTTYIVTRRCGP